MMVKGKRGFAVGKEEIERFCQGTERVLKKIYDKINEEQAKKKQKKKKTTGHIMEVELP